VFHPSEDGVVEDAGRRLRTMGGRASSGTCRGSLGLPDLASQVEGTAIRVIPMDQQRSTDAEGSVLLGRVHRVSIRDAPPHCQRGCPGRTGVAGKRP
jgi:hypothetical protein